MFWAEEVFWWEMWIFLEILDDQLSCVGGETEGKMREVVLNSVCS